MIRQWRIGSLSGGISLIGFGVLILVISYGGATWSDMKYLWPVTIIVLGLEVIVHSRAPRESGPRVSILGIVLVVLVILASLAGYTVSRVADAIGLANGQLAVAGNGHSVLVPVSGSLPVGSTVQNLNIQVPNADVRVTGGSGNTVVYQGELGVAGNNRAAAEKNLPSEWQAAVQGNTVQLVLNQPKSQTVWSLFSHLGNSNKGNLTVEIPARLFAQVRTVNGSITVNGVQQGVNAETVNGAVTVESVSGRVVEDAVNGMLTATQVNGDVQLHTVNGAMNVNQVRGRLSVDAVNGSVSVQSPVDGDWQLKTVNGGLTLTLPNGTNAAIDARSIRSITGNIAWQLNGGLHHATAVLGKGGPQVTLNTTNGGITVNQS